MTKPNNYAYTGAELPNRNAYRSDEAVAFPCGDLGIIGIDLTSSPDKPVAAMVNADGTIHPVWDSSVELEGGSIYPLYDGSADMLVDGGVINCPYVTPAQLVVHNLEEHTLNVNPSGFVTYADPDDIEVPGHYYRHDDDSFVKIELGRTPYSKSGIQYRPGHIPADDIGGYHEYLLCEGMAFRIDWGQHFTGPIIPPPPGPSQNGSESV